MRLAYLFRAGVMALAVAGATAIPALAQSGAPAGDATGITSVLSAGTNQSLFPQTVMPLPMPQGGGGFGGFQDRVKNRDTNFPDRQGRTLINVGTPYVNAIFGGLGEGSGLAGGLEFTTADALGKQFELYADAIVSTRLYRQLEVGMNIGKEKDRGEVRYIYTRRTRDNLFGLGPFSDPAPVFEPNTATFIGGETNYQRETRSFQAGYAHYFVENKFSIGAYVDYTSTSIYEGKDDADPSIFAQYTLFANDLQAVFPDVSEEFFTTQLPGLGTGSKVFTYGVYAEADYRSNDKGLTQGGYVYLRYAGHDGTDEVPAIFIGDTYDFGWNQFTADLRGYIPIFSDKTSIALRLYTDLNNTRGGDVIPFYNLARLGGGSSLRGFDTFRFYGANALLLQGEFRQTLYNFGGDIDKGIDLNIFGDAGQVWGLGYEPRRPVDFDFSRLDDFDGDNYETDLGLGFTARVSKGFALRVDYAHSNEENKFKLSFTRGF